MDRALLTSLSLEHYADLALDAAALAALVANGDRLGALSALKTAGVAKVGERQRLVNALARLHKSGELSALRAADAAPRAADAAPRDTTPLPGLRVAFVCHSGYFAGGSFGGALRASLAMIREVRRLGAADVLALAQPSATRLARALEGGALAEGRFDGLPVLFGGEAELLGALAGRRWHAVVALSLEQPILRVAAALGGENAFAMAHNYYMPPFGPFRRFPVRDGHVELLQRMRLLLCPSRHHAGYLERWGPPGLRTHVLYAGDYHYFDAAGGGLPPPMRPWEPAHVYVTLVSPAPEKGLSVLCALARRLPAVAFAAVATQWTDARTRARLAALPNVTVLEADADVDRIFARTRVLLAPSLWQEACPLVVTEAMLRAIPVVSSDVFGLPEANRNARLVVPTALAYDHARGTLHHGTTNDALEATLGADPPLPSALARGRAAAAAADAEATADEVAPYAALLTALLAPDGERLRRESAERVGVHAHSSAPRPASFLAARRPSNLRDSASRSFTLTALPRGSAQIVPL